ncbi:MAG: hypothetical protein EHM35_04560 [Planctomycetaceae bacterium]|nr:MAG: hypothetical protein EHM35_04560 [Planctomycetaceae bacterium]
MESIRATLTLADGKDIRVAKWNAPHSLTIEYTSEAEAQQVIAHYQGHQVMGHLLDLWSLAPRMEPLVDELARLRARQTRLNEELAQLAPEIGRVESELDEMVEGGWITVSWATFERIAVRSRTAWHHYDVDESEECCAGTRCTNPATHSISWRWSGFPAWMGLCPRCLKNASFRHTALDECFPDEEIVNPEHPDSRDEAKTLFKIEVSTSAYEPALAEALRTASTRPHHAISPSDLPLPSYWW